MEVKCLGIRHKVRNMAKKIVQMPVRIDEETRDQLKIYAIKRGITLNDLLVGYIRRGYEKEKASE